MLYAGLLHLSFFAIHCRCNFVLMLQRSSLTPSFIPKEIITLQEVLEEMERTDGKGNPLPFSLTWISCNHQRKTAGEFFSLESAIKPSTKGIRRVKSKLNKDVPERKKRMVDHFKNATRNIEENGTGQIRTVSIWDLLIFNNRRIVWYVHG